MMLVAGPHRNLFATLNNMLEEKEDYSRKGGSSSTTIITTNNRNKSSVQWKGKKLKTKSIGLFDFGARIKIVVLQEQNRSRIDLQVSLQEGCNLHEETIEHLKSLYGASVAFADTKNQQQIGKNPHKVSFSVTVNDAVHQFDSTQSCAFSLSQIRVQAAGAPILKALHRMDDTVTSKKWPTGSTSLRNGDGEYIYNLGTHGKCGSYHCISTSGKAMMVYKVCFEDEMERSLARLFLQQFQVTQSKVPLTPHCEYRRPNDATKELKQIMNETGSDESSKLPPVVGFLTFTFFPSSSMTEARRLKAIELLVNFYPYIDRHVKSTKSMMLSRMRMKRKDLLKAMKEPN